MTTATDIRTALAGRYEVEHELGQGGMAIVYRARDLRHERFVAIKVLRPELSPALGAERFLREISLAARLQHPHILPLYDSGDAGGLLYYVMPYIAGESLRQRLAREGQLPVDQALEIGREVADALEYAHHQDLVHRDIKPENILLSGDHAIVADFGIARAIDAAGGLKLTETGMAVGTPAYMSPEQATAADHIDGRADQYALACVLYEMLAGQPPFTGPSAQAVMARQSVDVAPLIRVLRPAVPATIETAITRALAKAPADRFVSVASFAAALVEGEARHGAASTGSRRWPRIAAAVAVLLLAGAVGVGTWAVRPAEAGREPSIAVLPLRNLGHDSEAYFAEGMTQELTSNLIRAQGLLVRPFATVAAEAAKGGDPLAIARRVQAEYVLTGSVRRSLRTIGVTVELIRVRDGSAVWSPTRFDGTAAADIFATQDSIARQLVGDLHIELAGSALGPHVERSRGTSDLVAYNLYLQGLHFQFKWTEASLQQAEGLFAAAWARDSGFADAIVALAETRAFLAELVPTRPASPGAPPDSLFRLALAIDSTNPTAHRQIAQQMRMSCDVAGVEREFRTALRFGPGAPETYVFYAQFLNTVGRHREALAAARRATELNPVSAFIAANLSYRYIYVGDIHNAMAEARRAIALDSLHWVPRVALGVTLGVDGHYREGIAEMREAIRLGARTHAWTLAWLGYLYGLAGQPDSARAIASEITRLAARSAERRVYSPHLGLVALIHAGLGNADSVAAWLERAYPPGDRRMIVEASEPQLARLRNSPPVAAVLRRIGCGG